MPTTSTEYGYRTVLYCEERQLCCLDGGLGTRWNRSSVSTAKKHIRRKRLITSQLASPGLFGSPVMPMPIIGRQSSDRGSELEQQSPRKRPAETYSSKPASRTRNKTKIWPCHIDIGQPACRIRSRCEQPWSGCFRRSPRGRQAGSQSVRQSAAKTSHENTVACAPAEASGLLLRNDLEKSRMTPS